MWAGEARISNVSVDSARFAVIGESPEEDAAHVLRQRALQAEKRIEDLRNQLDGKSAKHAEVEFQMVKTNSENKEMKHTLTELERRLQQVTQERHAVFLHDDEEAYKVRFESLEDEVSMYMKYAAELNAANSATANSTTIQREHQEALEQRIAHVEQEKLVFEHELAVLRRKCADVEDSMALRAITRWHSSSPTETPVAPLVTEALTTVAETTVVPQSADKSVGKTWSSESSASQSTTVSGISAISGVSTMSAASGGPEPSCLVAARARDGTLTPASSPRSVSGTTSPDVFTSPRASFRGSATLPAPTASLRGVPSPSVSPIVRPLRCGTTSPMVLTRGGAASPSVQTTTSPPLRASLVVQRLGSCGERNFGTSSKAIYPSTVVRHGA